MVVPILSVERWGRSRSSNSLDCYVLWSLLGAMLPSRFGQYKQGRGIVLSIGFCVRIARQFEDGRQLTDSE
jgi:hypothetical protein